MDGWHFGEAATDGVTLPYLLMSDDTPLPTPEDLGSPSASIRTQAILTDRDDRNMRANMARHGGYYMTIAGTRHVNFSDSPLHSLRDRLAEAGPLDPKRAHEIRNAYAVEFFNKFLVGEPSRLLDGNLQSYPEVRLTTWPRESGPSTDSVAGTQTPAPADGQP